MIDLAVSAGECQIPFPVRPIETPRRFEAVPTYQYACTECGHRLEEVQAFTDPSLTECPECSGRLRKVYGSVGVVFKGSGFYRTDSRAGSVDAAAAKTDSTSADKPAAKVNGGSGGSDSSGGSSNGKSGKSGESAPAKPAAATSGGSSSTPSNSTGSSSTKAAS